ncbi:MAG: hypothetical protein PUA96_09575 [Bacteroidales bacterium]|nr:hypothetical protein [Bacteroidales bacterium]
MKKFITIAILAIAGLSASAQSHYSFRYDCTKHYDSEGYYINTTYDSNLQGKTISFVWNSSTRSYEDVDIEKTFCSFSTEDVIIYNGERCYVGSELTILWGYIEYLSTDLSKYYYETGDKNDGTKVVFYKRAY